MQRIKITGLLFLVGFFIKTAHADVFILEGNIGAGKSTLLNSIEKYLQVPIFPEPVNEWQNINGENLLGLYYAHSQRWAYTLLTYVLSTRIEQQKQGEFLGKCCILDRSYLTNRFCFGKIFLKNGEMSVLEWFVYLALEKIISSTVVLPKGIIYLRTSPKTCYERMKKRNRSEEKGVTLEYLQELHTLHEEWLIEKKNIEPCLATIPVLILDGNKDFEHDEQAHSEFIEMVGKFISGR